jgi:hypothetical protein
VANINIERKERSGMMPWVIAGIALLALLAWFMFFRDGANVTNQASQGAVADSAFQTDTNRPR